MHLNTTDTARLTEALHKMAIEHGYQKIFAKIPASHWDVFNAAGYIKEAVIPGFFEGQSDGLFIAKFFSTKRQRTPQQERIDWIAHDSHGALLTNNPAPPIGPCTPADADAMAKIYHRVFESYPFPIHRPEYLKRIMDKGSRYFCIRIKKQIAAVAAAEIDAASKTCEMTDFATLPEYRGNGFAGHLLDRLDQVARNNDLKTAYTIARADSPGMNRVFQKMGYRYAGQLVNNSQIGGRIRSMRVWYKRL